MKRSLIAVLTIAVLLLAFSGLAVAADKTQEAADRLVDLGFVEGYEDGSLGLDNSITRAEFAKIAVIAAGYGDAEAMLRQSPTSFSDVGSGLWYTGWINVASSQGFVKGDPGGTFRPNDTISAAEVVTVLLRVLGYNDNLIGQWPTNYLVKAAGLGITKDIDFEANSAIIRGKVFQMLSKTLDADVVEYDHEYALNFSSKGVTLLEDALDLVKVKGVVTAIPRVDSSLEDNEIELVEKFGESGESVGVYEAVTNLDFEAIFGARVNAYINDDGEVLSVTLDNDWAVCLDAIEILKDAKELEFVDADKDYDIRDYAVVYIDGKSKKVSDLAKGDEYGYAKVLLDGRNRVVFVDAYNWEDWLVVEDVDGDDILGYGMEIDAEDYVIVKDGKAVDLDELEEGDILFYNRTAEFGEVYNKSVEGEIERIYDESIKVNGKEYKVDGVKYINQSGDIKSFEKSTKNYKDTVETMQDAGDVAVYLNRAGKMVFLSGDVSDLTTSSSYAFVHVATPVGAEYNVRNKAHYALDVVNAEGKLIKYDIAQADVQSNADGILFRDGTSGAIAWNATLLSKKAVEISLDKNGDVDKILILGEENADGVKTSANYVDVFKVNSDATVFLTEDYTTDAKDIDTSVWNELDFEKINSGKAYVKGDKVVAFVVSDSDRGEGDVYLTVATADGSKVYGKHIYTLSLVLDGEKVKNDTKEGIIGDARTVKKGDLLKVTFDKKNVNVDKVEKIANINDANLSGQAVGGLVSGVKSSDSSLKIDGVTYKLGVDGVVVDATDSYKVKSISSLKNNDAVAALLIKSGSTYADVIVKTEKAGVTPPSKVDGVVTYIDGTVVEVDGVVYSLAAGSVLRNEVGVIEYTGAVAISGFLGLDDKVFDIVASSDGRLTSMKYPAAAADKTAAKTVIDMIEALDPDAATYSTDITAARTAFGTAGSGDGSVTDSVAKQNLVTNEAKLVAAEDSEAFKTTHSAILAKTVLTVATTDQAAVTAAKTAYNAESAASKALLVDEKALLDALQAKIDELAAAQAQTDADTFKTAHATALGKTLTTVVAADNQAAGDVDVALTAYAGLSTEAKALLATEKALLDDLATRSDAIFAVNSVAPGPGNEVAMKAAIEDADLGLDLSVYNALIGAQKTLVIEALTAGGRAYTDTASVQAALNAQL